MTNTCEATAAYEIYWQQQQQQCLQFAHNTAHKISLENSAQCLLLQIENEILETWNEKKKKTIT